MSTVSPAEIYEEEENQEIVEVVQEEMSDYEYMMSCLYDND